KRIVRYLKGRPKLGIWYPKDSPFDLVAYSDSDYSSATQDRKSTTGGCQLLGRRLISWQYKKQTIMATSTTEFWSTARIQTTNEGTKILATVDGKPRTIFESSIRINLKLNDEAGISSLPDAELFENLALMGYNILPNQKFSFQKGQLSHQPSFSGRTVPLFDSMLVHQGEGSGTPTEPHHTPSPEAHQSPQHDLSSSIHPPVTTESIPTVIPTDIPPLRQYSKRARIAQSSALLTVSD
nr:uncharacterized mitochondrial protein AtMg00810-like [Tanacetum cinerariifolium]